MDNNDIWLRVKISPAVMVEVIEDQTGKKWNGHYTLGRDVNEALRPWRDLPRLTGGDYADKIIRFKASKKELQGTKEE